MAGRKRLVNNVRCHQRMNTREQSRKMRSRNLLAPSTKPLGNFHIQNPNKRCSWHRLNAKKDSMVAADADSGDNNVTASESEQSSFYRSMCHKLLLDPVFAARGANLAVPIPAINETRSQLTLLLAITAVRHATPRTVLPQK